MVQLNLNHFVYLFKLLTCKTGDQGRKTKVLKKVHLILSAKKVPFIRKLVVGSTPEIRTTQKLNRERSKLVLTVKSKTYGYFK